MTLSLSVQFSDSTDTAIQTYFTANPDPSMYPNLGTVNSNDARWKSFYDLFAAAGMASGLPVPG